MDWIARCICCLLAWPWPVTDCLMRLAANCSTRMPRRRGGEQDDAARVAHQDRRPRVGVVGVKLLDRDDVRLVLVEKAAELGFQLDQPVGQRRLRGQPDHAAVHQRRAEAACNRSRRNR